MVCLMTWMKSGLSFKDKGRSFALNQLIHVASISSISFAMASSGVRAELEVDPNFWAIFLMFLICVTFRFFDACLF